MKLTPADILEQVSDLPADWHGSGSVSTAVLKTLAELAGRPENSVETGTGKTSLLLSHLSAHHTIFTQDDAGNGNSLQAVQQSQLLDHDHVQFVIGPTQQTLREYQFEQPLDLVFIDGPHGYPFPELEYYALYPHMASGALLVIDDIQIPTIGHLFKVIAQDDMFHTVQVVNTTAFLRRTDQPTFDPLGDGWWLQRYNTTHMRISLAESFKRRLPPAVKDKIKQILKR